ncbi:MAG: DUF4093 domain-containing protein [Clostridia bacterium]|nr:DUF4093 domain-containing protein [Clostridia bacterium]
MIHIEEAIVVEGKYDKERLRHITDAPIICTHGFELYRSKRIIESIRQMAKTRGIIILTDSDRAGFRIRNYIKQCLGDGDNIKHAYIPHIEGKEKRKEKAGAEGLLGVEGIDEELLADILSKAGSVTEVKTLNKVTKAQFYADGFSGKSDSAERRRELARLMKLPPTISANAMLELINRAYGAEEYEELKNKVMR